MFFFGGAESQNTNEDDLVGAGVMGRCEEADAKKEKGFMSDCDMSPCFSKHAKRRRTSWDWLCTYTPISRYCSAVLGEHRILISLIVFVSCGAPRTEVQKRLLSIVFAHWTAL